MTSPTFGKRLSRPGGHWRQARRWLSLIACSGRAVEMTGRDRLPDFSQSSGENEIGAHFPWRETDPDLVFGAVGVAGFEPTTSSSRIRLGGGRHRDRWLFVLVEVLVLVGLRRPARLVLA